MERFDDAFFGFIVFVIAWGTFGVLGLIPWGHPDMNSGRNAVVWEWHMAANNAWLIWALFVTLASMAVGALAYALRRW